METRRRIIEKCKKIKEELGYSYEYIAEQTGIPKSTVVRFFSSPDGTSCLFDTVQQIESFLFGFNEPAPKNDKQLINEVPLSLVEMKESYELIIKARIDDFRKEHQDHLDDNAKNAEIVRELKMEYKEEIATLKEEFAATMAENKKEHAIQLNELKRNKAWLVAAVICLTVLIFLALVIDIFVLTNKGWFIK